MLTGKETGDLVGNMIGTTIKGLKVMVTLIVLMFLAIIGLIGTVTYLLLTRI